jgi:arginyl-tRNA synthetase
MFKGDTLLQLILPYIIDRGESYGLDHSSGLLDASTATSEKTKKRLVVEFSSPNIASEFQGKHLRSTILGSHISNLYEGMGWDVTRINYLGDWGKPIGLLGVGWEKYGSEEKFQNDPSGHLLEVYHKIYDEFLPELGESKKARDEGKDSAEVESRGLFAERNAYFKRMEDKDQAALALWKRVRDVNIESYTKLYARLNVEFDEYSGESQIDPDTIAEVEEILKSKGLLEESGGSQIVDLKKYKLGTVIIRDRKGSSTYMLRDLAAAISRDRKYTFDKMIYVVATDHNQHFSRLFKILTLMDLPTLASKLQHLSFSDSSSMSSKLDASHMLSDVLDRCAAAMSASLATDEIPTDRFPALARAVEPLSISALRVQELSSKRAADHSFDVARMTAFDPGTGPHLQYTYARLRKAMGEAPVDAELSLEQMSSLGGEAELTLLRLLVQYPDITHSALKVLEPSVISSFLAAVTAQVKGCLDEKGTGAVANNAEIALYEATRIVLANGMKLLGVIPISW